MRECYLISDGKSHTTQKKMGCQICVATSVLSLGIFSIAWVQLGFFAKKSTLWSLA